VRRAFVVERSPAVHFELLARALRFPVLAV